MKNPKIDESFLCGEVKSSKLLSSVEKTYFEKIPINKIRYISTSHIDKSKTALALGGASLLSYILIWQILLKQVPSGLS